MKQLQPEESPLEIIGTATWRQTVPKHLATPLAKAIRAFENNQSAEACRWFGECTQLCRNWAEAKPIFYFGGQAAEQEFFRIKGHRPHDPLLNEWRAITESILRAAIECAPNDPVLLHRLGRFLHDLGDVDESEHLYWQAIKYDPTQVETYGNLGQLLYERGDEDRAWRMWRKALDLPGEKASARIAQSYIWLRLGMYKEGWAAFNDRWKDLMFVAGYGRKDLDAKGQHWLGEKLPRRHSLLLHGEQGLGDHVQFARYAKVLAEKYNVVGLETRGILKRWMEACDLGMPIYERDKDELPKFTHHTSTMSLPGILNCEIPAPVAPWEPHVDELSPYARGYYRVGIAWEGAKGNMADRLRSIPSEQLAHLAGIPNVEWVNLVFDPTAPMTARAWLGASDGTWGCADTLDTAAVMRGLDLIVTVDTLTAHLAGTLGVPTIVLHRYCREWRWLDDSVSGTSCPWYPSVESWTQPNPGDWTGLLQRVRERLGGQRIATWMTEAARIDISSK